MIKAIFFDVDGTLLSHDTHCVPDSTVRALEALREKGIEIPESIYTINYLRKLLINLREGDEEC